jgi:Fe-S-cluster-containing dehydrogenase component
VLEPARLQQQGHTYWRFTATRIGTGKIGKGEVEGMTGRTVPRRAFLRLAFGGAVGAAIGTRAMAKRREGPRPARSARYALVVDATRCRGDGACVEACRLANGLPEGLRYIRILQKGDEQEPWFLPIQCQHCADPPCETVCPTRATYVRDDGVVLINPRLCVGCKYCMTACPYQARVFDEERGVVDKCWLCLERVQEGKLPACVEGCVVGARMFGRVDDPDSRVSKLIASGRAKPLHPDFDTRPSILTYVIAE